MSADKTEALRLADLIQSRYGNDINDEAADELRRLSAVEAQRDALLEALKKIAAIENKPVGLDWEEIEEARGIATAAIQAVEEGK